MEHPEDKGREIADAIISAANCMGGSEVPAETVRGLLGCHRTLNQSITGNFILPFIKGMAQKYRDHDYDLRNEAAVKVCHLMWSAMVKEHGFDFDANPRLPLI